MKEWLYQRFKRWARKPDFCYVGVGCLGKRHGLALKLSKRYATEYDQALTRWASDIAHGFERAGIKIGSARIQNLAVTCIKADSSKQEGG